jgi:hypothetical protein
MAKTDQPAKNEQAVPQAQAGTVISPGASQPAAPAPSTSAPTPPVLDPTPTPPAEISPQPPEDLPPEETAIAEAAPEATGDIPTITWTASEFVAHEKSAGWYTLLLTGAAIFAAVVYLLTKDFISTAVVLVAAILLAVFGSHTPREQQYMIDNQGIGIGPKHYSFDDFKSFAVASEGAFSSLVFMPLKRFAIPLTVYYAPKDEERILNVVSTQLPLEEHRLDAVDNLMRRIRF